MEKYLERNINTVFENLITKNRVIDRFMKAVESPSYTVQLTTKPEFEGVYSVRDSHGGIDRLWVVGKGDNMKFYKGKVRK